MSNRIAIAEAKRICALLKLVAPVVPVNVANTLGLRVFYMPDPNLAGLLLPMQRAILVGIYQSAERIAFSVAHEIGHWVLHRDSGILFANNNIDNKREREANVFAAELLMPYSQVKEAARHMEFTTMAAHFGVSLQAMDIRLQELGIKLK